ncbi:MAG: GNAT family N-acetyltransferase [Ferruginibacter sp.]|nr:GNAT family N-acetyltransferase [Ferruginibacter sp.]
MELKPIELNIDRSQEMYSSTNCQLVLNAMIESYTKNGFNKPWVGYLACKNNQLVGTGGFVETPEDGKVEIAYWTFKEFEGQGVASFVCKELIKISKATDATIIITAKTAPEHNASTKILQKNGFAFTEIINDDEIGNAWLWTLDK